MIKVQRVSDLPYPVVCYACGKKADGNGIRIEVSNPTRLRGTTIYLCSECRREIREKV